MDKEDIRDLKKRYLVWFYKATKEAFDKVERKFTQAEVDKFILADLKKQDKDKTLEKFIAEFEEYIRAKEKSGQDLKYDGTKIKPEYAFLEAKLKAIEKAIIKEVGFKGLDEIKALYEKEMTERILKSTEH